ncbi:conserved hypothetical protein [Orientia tsutsugamushi str. Boryong]|uniref:Uncharacterized protein n=1 Tax=Orientia tsutsugamushi (strain Boryong) TaxID=357244 RepID=A5CCS9_ORITB|nr:conserved hypothetical protein [Orientia tsutsugamushi str. Boryong]
MILILFLILLLISLLFFLNYMNMLLPYFLSHLIFSLQYPSFSYVVTCFLIYAISFI